MNQFLFNTYKLAVQRDGLVLEYVPESIRT